MIRSTRIVKGSVTIPRELRMKYKMYEYASIALIELEDGILIKLLTGDESPEELVRSRSARPNQSLDTEVNMMIAEILNSTSG
ncbi:MAG: hypothetical protein ACUVQ8_06525 [Nitrososphaeria archaeon]